MHTSKQRAKRSRSKADMQQEIKWLYEKLWELIQEASPIQRHHAGLQPGDVRRIEVRVRQERE